MANDLSAYRVEAPHRTAGHTHEEIIRAWLTVSAIVGAWGIAFFGVTAFQVLLICVLSAVATDWLVSRVLRRPVVGGFSHTCLTGMLLGLTLPPTVAWYVPLIGTVVAILFGKVLFGGIGRYTWQPALVGRVFLQVFFSYALVGPGPGLRGPVLLSDHLVVGDIAAAKSVELFEYPGWFAMRGPNMAHAVLYERPVSALRRFAEGGIKPEDDLIFEPLLRDALPPWQDTLFGVVPGGIGETSTLVLIVSGLYLIYRGYLRWQLPVCTLAAAALIAAVLPVETGGSHSYDWLPVLSMEQDRPVGLAYVLYHLTSGELMLGAFLLAGDMIASPMRARGQAIFGAGIGALTIFMRLYGLLDGECYWSILIMNTLVSVLDRRTGRDVLGIATRTE